MDIFFNLLSYFFNSSTLVREVKAYLSAMVVAGTVLLPFTEEQMDEFWGEKRDVAHEGAAYVVRAIADEIAEEAPYCYKVAEVAEGWGWYGRGAVVMAAYAMFPQLRELLEVIASTMSGEEDGEKTFERMVNAIMPLELNCLVSPGDIAKIGSGFGNKSLTWTELVEEKTGYKGKALRKALLNVESERVVSSLIVIGHLKDVLSQDGMVKLLRDVDILNNLRYCFCGENNEADVSLLVGHFGEKKFLKMTNSSDGDEMEEAARLYSNILVATNQKPHSKVKTFEEAIKEWSVEAEGISEVENPNKKLLALEGVKICSGGLTIRNPSTSKELRDWSSRLHNCAADYAIEIQAKRTNIIVLVDQAEKPIYMVEIKNDGRIEQFMAACNDPLSPDDPLYKEVEAMV